MNKKAEIGLITVIIILIVFIFLGWLIQISGRECKNNNECKEEYYCGSDFSCHKFPVIEKSSIIVERHYTFPAIIIGISIIVSAIILRWDKIRQKKQKEGDEKGG